MNRNDAIFCNQGQENTLSDMGTGLDVLKNTSKQVF